MPPHIRPYLTSGINIGGLYYITKSLIDLVRQWGGVQEEHKEDFLRGWYGKEYCGAFGRSAIEEYLRTRRGGKVVIDSITE